MTIEAKPAMRAKPAIRQYSRAVCAAVVAMGCLRLDMNSIANIFTMHPAEGKQVRHKRPCL
jgi:hypothetical protein